MRVVGITGSYGKTTTKELLEIILSRRFKTYSTPRSVNTDIGVANTILGNVGPLADVFIVEMGAYKRGEIEAICNIVKPDFAILTGISEQHLALFGNIENVLRAKYEIVENSKENAIIVLNGDDNLVLRVAGKSSKKEILYSVKKELDVWASDIKSSEDRVDFNVHFQGKVQRFEVKILGEHNVSNILAAISVALQFGMSLSEIAKELEIGSKGRAVGRLAMKRSKFGYRVIDDSYNSNPNGFLAALNFLEKMEANRKILVTVGIIELGKGVGEVYPQLSKKIVRVADTVVTTDKKLVQYIKEQDEKLEVIFDEGIDRQLKFLKERVGKADVVLFEGPNLRLIEEIVQKEKE